MNYHLTYEMKAHPEGLTRDQVPKDRGACTAAFLLSLLYPEDGSYSVAAVSFDGRTGAPLENEDAELWKAWVMLAHRLAQSETLSPNKRELCREVFKVVTNAVLASRSDDQALATEKSRTGSPPAGSDKP